MNGEENVPRLKGTGPEAQRPSGPEVSTFSSAAEGTTVLLVLH